MHYIYLHGFLSGPDSVKGNFFAGRFRELGIKLQRPDLNAGDFEHLTLTRQLTLMESYIDSLTDDVVLLGSSLGGFLAALLAENRRKVQGLVLMAPAFDFVSRYLSQMPREQLTEWKQQGYIELYHYHSGGKRRLYYGVVEDAAKYREVRFIRQLPVLIFHGIRDESVPYRVSLDYLQDHSGTELVLFHSDHSLLDKLDEMWRYMRAFLEL